MVTHPHCHPRGHTEQDPDARVRISAGNVFSVEVIAQCFNKKFVRPHVVSENQTVRKTISKVACKILTLPCKFYRFIAFAYVVYHSDPQNREKKGYPDNRSLRCGVPERLILSKNGLLSTQKSPTSTYLSHERRFMENVCGHQNLAQKVQEKTKHTDGGI